MKSHLFDKLLRFLNRLEQEKINYTLAHNRDNSIMITVVIPGERWEVEFIDDGSVEVEQFISDGEIYGESILNGLFARFSDAANNNLEPYAKPRLAAVG
jgi:hypothetical protein